MIKNIAEWVLRIMLGLIVALIILSPGLGIGYLGAWLIDWLIVDINFESWITHTVIVFVALVVFVMLLNTKEGGEMLWTSVTGKR